MKSRGLWAVLLVLLVGCDNAPVGGECVYQDYSGVAEVVAASDEYRLRFNFLGALPAEPSQSVLSLNGVEFNRSRSDVRLAGATVGARYRATVSVRTAGGRCKPFGFEIGERL